MLNDVSSRHLRNATELLVLVPIKQGFVPIADTVSYVTRLRTLLSALFELRRVLAERELGWVAGPIEKLQSIFNSQWTILPGNRHLLVTVNFDRSWEEYFQFLVRHAGPALDLIFCHCEGYSKHQSRDHGALRYQAFAEFIRARQIPCDFYYATAPDITVDDLTYLKKLAAQPELTAQRIAELKVGSAQRETDELQYAAALGAVLQARPDLPEAQHAAAVDAVLREKRDAEVRKLLAGLFELREWFPGQHEPDGASIATATARAMFDAAVINLVPDLARITPPDPPRAPLQHWLAALAAEARREPRHDVPAPTEIAAEDLAQIQGNILTGYPEMTHGCAVLLRCDGPAAAADFLRRMESRITLQSAAHGDGPFTNLAITYAGLTRLGLSNDVLAWFPKEFREGMERRAGSLGDVGLPNHPDYWQLPAINWADGRLVTPAKDAPHVALAAVDFVVLLQTKSRVEHAGPWADHPLRERVEQLDGGGTHVLHVQLLARHSLPTREHFGFPDGGSQPVPDAVLKHAAPGDHCGRPAPRRDVYLGEGKHARDLVPVGELLLGHEDSRGERAWCTDPERNPRSRELFVNGSFLVVRKLDQDVAAFQAFADARAKELNESGAREHADVTADQVKEWTLGRKLSGEPLVPLAGKDGNDFEYAACKRDGGDYPGDPDGQKCPMHAHIRRSNPRVTDERGRGAVPRIMRRGFSYGPPHPQPAGATGRGLLFMAFNASIASQFEVIQRWLNGGNPTGIPSGQNDLFSGGPQPAAAAHWVHDGARWRALRAPAHPFVSLRWGMYLFAPSRRAIGLLAGAARAAADPAAAAAQPVDPEIVARGNELIVRLAGIEAQEGREAARRAWKSVIEEPANARMAAAVWSAIRARGGSLNTAYALLVGNKEGAAQVLGGGKGRLFSVREYWHRLQATTGEHYLSFDPRPARLTSSDPAAQARHSAYEARMAEVSYADTAATPNGYIHDRLNDADSAHEAARSEASAILDAQVAPDARAEVHVRVLASRVVARLSRTWFGLPDVPGDQADDDAELVHRLEQLVLASRFSFQPYPEPALTEAATAAGERVRNNATAAATDFSRALDRAGYDPAATRRAMIGSVVGFAAPAIGSITTVLHQWTESGELWRLADALRTGAPDDALRGAVLAALGRTPIPPLLYRTAMPGAELAGRPVEPGTLVVVGLAAASADEGDWKWLFGGDRRTNPHACPARYAALGVITGVAAALLARRDLRRERALVLSFA